MEALSVAYQAATNTAYASTIGVSVLLMGGAVRAVSARAPPKKVAISAAEKEETKEKLFIPAFTPEDGHRVSYIDWRRQVTGLSKAALEAVVMDAPTGCKASAASQSMGALRFSSRQEAIRSIVDHTPPASEIITASVRLVDMMRNNGVVTALRNEEFKTYISQIQSLLSLSKDTTIEDVMFNRQKSALETTAALLGECIKTQSVSQVEESMFSDFAVNNLRTSMIRTNGKVIRALMNNFAKTLRNRNIAVPLGIEDMTLPQILQLVHKLDEDNVMHKAITSIMENKGSRYVDPYIEILATGIQRSTQAVGALRRMMDNKLTAKEASAAINVCSLMIACYMKVIGLSVLHNLTYSPDYIYSHGSVLTVLAVWSGFGIAYDVGVLVQTALGDTVVGSLAKTAITLMNACPMASFVTDLVASAIKERTATTMSLSLLTKANIPSLSAVANAMFSSYWVAIPAAMADYGLSATGWLASWITSPIAAFATASYTTTILHAAAYGLNLASLTDMMLMFHLARVTLRLTLQLAEIAQEAFVETLNERKSRILGKLYGFFASPIVSSMMMGTYVVAASVLSTPSRFGDTQSGSYETVNSATERSIFESYMYTLYMTILPVIAEDIMKESGAGRAARLLFGETTGVIELPGDDSSAMERIRYMLAGYRLQLQTMITSPLTIYPGIKGMGRLTVFNVLALGENLYRSAGLPTMEWIQAYFSPVTRHLPALLTGNAKKDIVAWVIVNIAELYLLSQYKEAMGGLFVLSYAPDLITNVSRLTVSKNNEFAAVYASIYSNALYYTPSLRGVLDRGAFFTKELVSTLKSGELLPLLYQLPVVLAMEMLKPKRLADLTELTINKSKDVMVAAYRRLVDREAVELEGEYGAEPVKKKKTSSRKTTALIAASILAIGGAVAYSSYGPSSSAAQSNETAVFIESDAAPPIATVLQETVVLVENMDFVTEWMAAAEQTVTAITSFEEMAREHVAEVRSFYNLSGHMDLPLTDDEKVDLQERYPFGVTYDPEVIYPVPIHDAARVVAHTALQQTAWPANRPAQFVENYFRLAAFYSKPDAATMVLTVDGVSMYAQGRVMFPQVDELDQRLVGSDVVAVMQEMQAIMEEIYAARGEPLAGFANTPLDTNDRHARANTELLRQQSQLLSEKEHPYWHMMLDFFQTVVSKRLASRTTPMTKRLSSIFMQSTSFQHAAIQLCLLNHVSFVQKTHVPNDDSVVLSLSLIQANTLEAVSDRLLTLPSAETYTQTAAYGYLRAVKRAEQRVAESNQRVEKALFATSQLLLYSGIARNIAQLEAGTPLAETQMPPVTMLIGAGDTSRVPVAVPQDQQAVYMQLVQMAAEFTPEYVEEMKSEAQGIAQAVQDSVVANNELNLIDTVLGLRQEEAVSVRSPFAVFETPELLSMVLPTSLNQPDAEPESVSTTPDSNDVFAQAGVDAASMQREATIVNRLAARLADAANPLALEDLRFNTEVQGAIIVKTPSTVAILPRADLMLFRDLTEMKNSYLAFILRTKDYDLGRHYKRSHVYAFLHSGDNEQMQTILHTYSLHFAFRAAQLGPEDDAYAVLEEIHSGLTGLVQGIRPDVVYWGMHSFTIPNGEEQLTIMQPAPLAVSDETASSIIKEALHSTYRSQPVQTPEEIHTYYEFNIKKWVSNAVVAAFGAYFAKKALKGTSGPLQNPMGIPTQHEVRRMMKAFHRAVVRDRLLWQEIERARKELYADGDPLVKFYLFITQGMLSDDNEATMGAFLTPAQRRGLIAMLMRLFPQNRVEHVDDPLLQANLQGMYSQYEPVQEKPLTADWMRCLIDPLHVYLNRRTRVLLLLPQKVLDVMILGITPTEHSMLLTHETYNDYLLFKHICNEGSRKAMQLLQNLQAINKI